MSTRTLTRIALACLVGMSGNASALYYQGSIIPTYDGNLTVDGSITTEPTPAPLPEPEPEVLPAVPGVSLQTQTLDTVTLAFTDKSDIEAGFTLYRRGPGSEWENLGSFGAIDNRSAEYFIIDGPETGFSVWPVRIPGSGDTPLYQTSESSYYHLGFFQDELASNTEYCYRLVPYNEQGTEPDNVPGVCARTTLNLKQGSSIDEVSTSPTSSPNSFGIDVSPYDTAVLVRDREGLRGELEKPWNGRKLVFVQGNRTLDLSYYPPLPLGHNLTLKSDRDKLREGALLVSSTLEKPAMFDVTGNNVVVTGLRFQGPSASSGEDVSRKATAISLSVNERFAERYLSVETPLSLRIENNEFYAWPKAAVSINSKLSKLPFPDYEEYGGSLYDYLVASNNSPKCSVSEKPDPLSPYYKEHVPGEYFQDEGCIMHMDAIDRVKVSRNYFHHNQRKNSGYGVVVAGYSYVDVNDNTFDQNRHAIASTGGRNAIVNHAYGPQQHGYRATHNLVLPGHADQCQDLWIADLCWETHHFDVHGTSDGTFADYYDGWAGELIRVYGNSFMGVHGLQGDAFNIRGTPSFEAHFRNNVLPKSGKTWDYVNEESDDDSRIIVRGNKHYVDGRRYLRSGDFDGDGFDDVFMATGAAWYYSSGGKTEWRLLNRYPDRMDSLVLADFDGDRKTDVLKKEKGGWYVSAGGTGQWQQADGFDPDAYPAQAEPDDTTYGDFDGDGNRELLEFEWWGDRFFYINGNRYSRHQM